jgi:hypothetical protein
MACSLSSLPPKASFYHYQGAGARPDHPINGHHGSPLDASFSLDDDCTLVAELEATSSRRSQVVKDRSSVKDLSARPTIRRGKISKRRAGRPSLIDAADSRAALPPALPVPEALGNPVAGRDRLSNRGIDIARPVRSAAWWSGISARIRIAAGSVIIARLCNRG